MISGLNMVLRERDRLREELQRLHAWALAQEGDCMFSGDHPIAQAAAVLAGVTAAPAPHYWCKKCGYRGMDQVVHQRPNGTGECGYIASLVPPA